MSDSSDAQTELLSQLDILFYPHEHYNSSRDPSLNARPNAPDQIDMLLANLAHYDVCLRLNRPAQPEDTFLVSSYGFTINATLQNHPDDPLWEKILQRKFKLTLPEYAQYETVGSCSWRWSEEEQRITHLFLSTSLYDDSNQHKPQRFINREVDIAWAQSRIEWIWQKAFGSLELPPIVLTRHRDPNNFWRYGDWNLACSDGELGQLVQTVMNGTWRERAKATRRLGEINQPQILPILIKLVEYDSANSVHKAAAEALCAYEHEAAQKLYDKIIESYTEGDYYDPDNAYYRRLTRLFDTLQLFGTTILDLHITQLARHDIDMRHRVHIFQILRSLDSEAVTNAFQAHLTDFDSEIQQRLQRVVASIQTNSQQKIPFGDLWEIFRKTWHGLS